MKNLTAFFIVLMLCTFASCKKEASKSLLAEGKITSIKNETNDLNNLGWETIYGLDYKNVGVNATEKKLDIAGLKLARNQLMFSKKEKGSFIDKYIRDGYYVQINLNWSNTIFGPVAFPTDTNEIKANAEAVFQYYLPYRDQIPVVVVENEWDNTNYHTGDIADYLTELRIVTEIGHQYGFKIADAGLSSTNLRRWTFTQLNDDESEVWKDNYFVGEKMDNYSSVIATVNEYAEGVTSIPIDYLNVHWYNVEECFNGFATAAQAYLKACGKNRIMTNEFGIKTDSDALFSQTIEELRNVAYFAISYSGPGGEDKAATITDDMLEAF